MTMILYNNSVMVVIWTGGVNVSPRDPRRRHPWCPTTLTIQTLCISPLPAVVPLVEVVIRAGVVVHRIAHVHVPGVTVAQLAVVSFRAVGSSVRTIIERSAHEVPSIGTLPLALGQRGRSRVSSDERFANSGVRPHLSEVVLFVASGHEGRSTDNWTTACTERSRIVHSTFANVTAADYPTVVAVTTVNA